MLKPEPTNQEIEEIDVTDLIKRIEELEKIRPKGFKEVEARLEACEKSIDELARIIERKF